MNEMMRKVKEKYPHLSETCFEVCKLIDVMRQDKNVDQIELEARLGKIENNKFINGITRSKMDNIIQIMQHSSSMYVLQEWQEEHDIFFMFENSEYRSRVQFNSDLMTISSNTIKKVNLGKLDIHASEGEDMRISLKKEIPIHIENIPHAVNPSYVRIKQRKSFKCENSDWRFDFTLSWEGKTKDDAEIKQQTCEPTFEFECELTNHNILQKKSNEYIATSLLLKMCDFSPKNIILQPLM